MVAGIWRGLYAGVDGGMITGRFPLLDGLDAGQVAALNLDEMPVSVAAGEALFKQGEPTSGLFFIDSGSVRLIGRTPGDGEVILAQLGAGEMVGEFSLLDGGPRSASAIAQSAVQAWRVGRERFAALAASGEPGALLVMDRLRVDVAQRTAVTIGGIAAALTDGAGTARPTGSGGLPPVQPATGLAGLLSSFPGFDRLTDRDWAELEALTQRVDAPRGTLLTPAGGISDGLVIVARGAVRVGTPHPSGGIEQLLLHGPGSFSGVAAMLDGGPAGLVRDVREAATLLFIDRAGFEVMRGGTTALGRTIFAAVGQQMVRDLRRLSRMLGRLSGGAG